MPPTWCQVSYPRRLHVQHQSPNLYYIQLYNVAPIYVYIYIFTYVCISIICMYMGWFTTTVSCTCTINQLSERIQVQDFYGAAARRSSPRLVRPYAIASPSWCGLLIFVNMYMYLKHPNLQSSLGQCQNFRYLQKIKKTTIFDWKPNVGYYFQICTSKNTSTQVQLPFFDWKPGVLFSSIVLFPYSTRT